MKKTIVSFLLMTVMILTSVSTVFADDISTDYVDGIITQPHKIKNKWDFFGTFDDQRGWLGDTYFEIHIKQAEYGPYSKGVILFESGDDYITAHVEDMKTNYGYGNWADTTNIAAVGWAEYNGMKFNFMFLYNADKIWIALKDASYTTEWESDTVWDRSSRYFELHSFEDAGPFEITPK